MKLYTGKDGSLKGLKRLVPREAYYRHTLAKQELTNFRRVVLWLISFMPSIEHF